MDNLEYKVITSNTPAFANREKLQKVLAEEAQAGWRLVEKFDNHRIRLARDVTARERDGALSFDAYRTSVGVNNAVFLAVAAAATLLVIYIVIQLAAMSVG